MFDNNVRDSLNLSQYINSVIHYGKSIYTSRMDKNYCFCYDTHTKSDKTIVKFVRRFESVSLTFANIERNCNLSTNNDTLDLLNNN